MNHRIFANGFLYYFEDRQSVDESLIRKDPKTLVGGDVLNVLGQDYVLTDYREHTWNEEENLAKNEFHEIAQDWFVDVEEKEVKTRP